MTVRVADSNQLVFFYESGTYSQPLQSGSRVSGLWISLVTEHTPTIEENNITIKYTGTSDRNIGQFVQGTRDIEGTISYHPQDFRMFGFALGSTVDTGSPSPYLHNISEINSDDSYAFNDSSFPSFTLEDSHKSAGGNGKHQIRTFKGCKVNSLSLTASQGEAVTCELNWIGQLVSVGSKTSDISKIFDEDTSRPFVWSDVKVHIPSGTVWTEINEISWAINNNLERRHYVNGSRVIQDLVPLNREYEVSITMDENDTHGATLLETYHLGGSTFNMMIDVDMSTGSEQSFIIMSGCKVTSFESPSPNEGIGEYSITISPQTCAINANDLIQNHNPY